MIGYNFISPVPEIIAGVLSKPEHSLGLTRSELVELTGVPRTTLYDNLVRLMLMRKVKRVSLKRARKGRPKIRWKWIP